MKMHWGSLRITPLDGGEWSASHTGRFTPKEMSAGIHWIRGWVDPRAGLDVVFLPRIEPRSSSHHTDWGIAVPIYIFTNQLYCGHISLSIHLSFTLTFC